MTVRSVIPADSVAGTVRAEDADGLDSVWVTVDTIMAGEDGGFDQVFSAPFRFAVGAGMTPGTLIPIEFRARDIAGFVVVRDTHVVVVP